jgi:hypothetical protein
MDEETCNFYQYNLNIFPRDHVQFAITYIMKLLGILLNKSQKTGNYNLYYKDILKGMKRQLDRFGIKSSDLKNKEKCEDIINDFNNWCYMQSEEEMN